MKYLKNIDRGKLYLSASVPSVVKVSRAFHGKKGEGWEGRCSLCISVHAIMHVSRVKLVNKL